MKKKNGLSYAPSKEFPPTDKNNFNRGIETLPMLTKSIIIGNKYFNFNMISVFNITLMLDGKKEENPQKMERETNNLIRDTA